MEMINSPITLEKLKTLANNIFGSFVKAVVDIAQEKIAIDAELHSDEEQYLLENGSKQSDLWGINLYPNETKENWIEFDSMINLRPSQGNFSRNINNQEIRDKITQTVNKLIKR